MLKKLYSLLSNEELLFLNSICSSFIETREDSNFWRKMFYIRKQLNKKTDLLEYQKKCIIYFESEYELEAMWINKITSNNEEQNYFHIDRYDLSIFTYLNEDFEGGEFEYILSDKKIKIKPIINSTLIINKEIKHRILNVTKGERFSLVSFYNKIEKKEKKQKTLI